MSGKQSNDTFNWDKDHAYIRRDIECVWRRIAQYISEPFLDVKLENLEKGEQTEKDDDTS